MNAVEACPICRKLPVKMVFGAGYAQDGYRCCGHTADTREQWNQYVVALVLARLTYQIKTCFFFCAGPRFGGIFE